MADVRCRISSAVIDWGGFTRKRARHVRGRVIFFIVGRLISETVLVPRGWSRIVLQVWAKPGSLLPWD